MNVRKLKSWLQSKSTASEDGHWRTDDIPLFHVADILLVGSAASVACHGCVILTFVAYSGLLDPLLFLGKHPACRIHAGFPFVDLLLYFLH